MQLKVHDLLPHAADVEQPVAGLDGVDFGCIHPQQVAATNAAFAPSEEELAWADRVAKAFDAAAGSAVQVDGKMVDRPVIERARQLLADAGRAGA